MSAFESCLIKLTRNSERKWKEKMKEWEFDKNIPAKEMGFMAAKARKRELEEGKETVYYRNGTLWIAIRLRASRSRSSM